MIVNVSNSKEHPKATASGNGSLLVFEGPDGAGKSELAMRLVKSLRDRGAECELIAFPGNEPRSLGRHVYRIHHEPASLAIDNLHPASLQTLHIAAHIDEIEGRILPALRKGRIVILDRFWWSTWVYGRVAGVKPKALRHMVQLEGAYWGRVRPAVVFLIRRGSAGCCTTGEDRARLVHEYDILAEREHGKYPIHVIDNNGTLTAAAKRVFDWVSKHTGVIPLRRGAAKAPQAFLAFSQPPQPSKSHTVISRLSPAKPTEVFDTYWRFAAERQAVFFRRLHGETPPWTEDAVLSEFKFTNAYRASDRVSQYLIRNVIYGGDQAPEEVFFRTILFKMFNRIGTWELLNEKFGEITYEDFSFRRYDRVLSKAIERGDRLYSAAYIMPSGRSVFGYARKHRTHLKIIERMMEDEVARRIEDASSMQEVFELLLSYPTIGPFLAYQYATDLNYSEMTSFDEMHFVVPGPGALDGIRKCFSDLGGLNEVEIIKVVADQQEDQFARLGLSFQSLWGRRLQLIDCQNLFCEVSKYARVAHPEAVGLSQRTRIKQKYRPTPAPIEYFYPPKWSIDMASKVGASP
jgi:thymidylate kinase